MPGNENGLPHDEQEGFPQVPWVDVTILFVNILSEFEGNYEA
jgi:hypothetical protein